MKELFCLLYCFVLLKGWMEPFSYVRIRDKDFEPADVKLFFRRILLYCTTNLYTMDNKSCSGQKSPSNKMPHLWLPGSHWSIKTSPQCCWPSWKR